MSKRIKITYGLFLLTVLSLVVHNALYGLFKREEAVSFILTLCFGLGFGCSVVLNLLSYTRTGEPEDLWRLGWLGLFGMAGVVPGFYGILGFFGFFGLFGAKRQE